MSIDRQQRARSRRIHCLAIAVSVLVVYLQALGAGYLPIDDGDMLRAVHSGKMTISSIFLSGGKEYYRPLATLSLLGDFLLFGGKTAGYHLGNVLLHLANSLLAYALAANFFREEGTAEFPAFLAALLFAVHPVNSEAVVWISCRPDLLCCFFLLLSLNILFRLGRGGGTTALAGMGLFFLCSLLAKEASLFLLPAAGCYLLLKRQEIGLRKAAKVLAALMLPIPAYLMLRQGLPMISPAPMSQTVLSGTSHGMSVVDAFAAFSFYIRKLLFPFPLSFTITKINTGLYAGISLFIMAAAAFLWKKEERIRIPMIFLAASTTPPIGAMLLLPIWTPYAERYLYIPSVFFVLCAVFLLIRLVPGIPRSILVATLLIPAVATGLRVKLWTEPLSFWQKAVAQAPDFGTARLVLASEYLKAGRYQEADENLRLAVQLGLPNKSMESFREIRKQLDEKLGKTAASSSH